MIPENMSEHPRHRHYRKRGDNTRFWWLSGRGRGVMIETQSADFEAAQAEAVRIFAERFGVFPQSVRLS